LADLASVHPAFKTSCLTHSSLCQEAPARPSATTGARGSKSSRCSPRPRPLPCRMVRTYAEAGVSQEEKAAHIAALVSALRYRRKGFGKPLTKIGHFTGLVDFGSYALSLCTDSVGTKVLVAKEMRKWDTIGIDCVAMNVND